MYTLNWQPPYDWSWMLGFLAARAVSGVETVADSYYARSLAVGEYRGVVTAIPDIARHTLHINLSAGLEPVAAECLAKMSRLFDLQCNPRISSFIFSSIARLAIKPSSPPNCWIWLTKWS